MKTNVCSASAAVFVAFGIGLAAQTAAQNPPPAPSPGSPGRIMVTGCGPARRSKSNGHQWHGGLSRRGDEISVDQCRDEPDERGVHKRINGKDLSTGCGRCEAHASCRTQGRNQRDPRCGRRQRDA